MAKEQGKKRPQIDILERRLAGGSVFGLGSPTIELKEPGWECRWFNSEVAADHIWRAKNRKGWDNVRPEELADPEQIGGYQTSPDGFVVRGEKGREVLLKMPSDYRRQIERKKAQENIRNMDPHRQKVQVAEAAGKQFGDEAGSFINKNVNLIGNITTTRERIAVSPDAE